MLLAAGLGFAGKGPPEWALPAMVGFVVVFGVVILVLAVLTGGKGKKQSKRGGKCKQCGRVVMPEWTQCRFCKAALVDLKDAALEFVSGPLVGKTVGLDRDVTTIGSVEGNTVLLTDTGVSRKHVGIKRVPDGFELADLGSTNGVYVNGEKVARRKLAVGDVIRVGTTEMVFRT